MSPKISLLLSCVVFAAGCSAQSDALIVMAPSSLAESIPEFAKTFQRDVGIPVEVRFAATSILARQILQGADADVFLSAHPRWMDRGADGKERKAR